MRITEEVIDDIRNSASITEVIGHYIPLTKKGKGYTALCPFHDDHDPSLSISEDKKIFKCFVCGAGGNVFSFVQRFKNVTFPEAVAEVGEIVGKHIELDVQPVKKVSKYQHYYDLMQNMISYSNYLLTGSKKGSLALEYLANRGIEAETIERYGIGYNPDENYIYKYLASKGFSDEDMIKCNVARMTEKGLSDVFYRRIVFPIHNQYGDPIGFTARDFTGFSESKYINTSETQIYTKGDIVFNYHRAKEEVKKLGYVIICEGVMDVIAYDRAGIKNVVATLGTACTKNQLSLMKELCNRFVLSYDGDNAGKAANLKLGEMAIDAGVNVEVLDNKTGLDPDEIVGKYGKNALRDLLNKRLSYIDFAMKYYKEKLNMENYSDRKQMMIKVSSLIDKLQDEYDKENYSNELYEFTKLRRVEKQVRKPKDNKKVYQHQYSIDGLTKAEYTILVEMSYSLKATEIYQKDLGYLLDETNQEMAMLIIDQYRTKGQCSFPRIYDECKNDNIRSLIETLATIDCLPESFDEDVLRGSMEKVKTEIKREKLNYLEQKIKNSISLDDIETREMLKEYSELVKDLGRAK